MMPPGRLALRVAPPQAEEPAYGVFCRLAARHRLQDARAMAKRVGCLFKQIVSGIHRGRVERLAGLRDGTLERSTVRYDGYDAVVGGQRLYRLDWVTRPSRICVGCLQEDLASPDQDVVPHRRFWWDYKPIEICPRHGCELEAACKRCGKSYPFWRTDLTRCPCGAPVSGRSVERIHPDLVEADGYILARLMDAPHARLPVLDAISLRHIQTTLLTVGGPPGSSMRTLERTDMAARSHAKAAAYRIFEGWPDAFHAMLDTLLVSRPAAGVNTSELPERTLTPYRFYQHRLMAVLGREGQEPISDEYERHFLRNVACGINTRVFRKPAGESAFLTLTAANVALGLRPGAKRLLPVLFDLGLIEPGMPYSRTIPVPRNSLPSIKEALDDRLSFAAAERRLGVTDQALRALIDSGHLSVVRNEYDDGPRLSGVSIDLFVSELVRGAAKPRRRNQELMSLVEAARMPPGFDGVIRAVQEDKLRVVARRRDRAGLDGLLFRSVDVLAWRQRSRRHPRGEPSGADGKRNQ